MSRIAMRYLREYDIKTHAYPQLRGGDFRPGDIIEIGGNLYRVRDTYDRAPIWAGRLEPIPHPLELQRFEDDGGSPE